MSAEKATKVSVKKTGGQFWRNLISKWPFLVWLGVAFLALKLHKTADRFERMNGVVFAEYENVAALTDGKIERLEVELNQIVTKGQTIAVMDTALIDLEIKALGEELKFDKLDRRLKYQENKTKAKLAEARAKAEKAAAEQEWTNARAEFNRVNESGTGAEKLLPNIARLNANIASAAAKASEYSEDYMKELADSVNSAGALLDELDKAEKESAVSERLTLLQKQKKNMTITTTRSGVVAQVNHRAGEIVQGGDPIVLIVTDKTTRVRGLVVDEYVSTVSVGDPVWVTPEHNREDIRKATVSAVAPIMTGVPDQTSTVPNRMVFGREIVCELPEGDTLLPNQRVIIHVNEPGEVDFWSLSQNHRDPNPRD
jgi:multidrug resistance efflux pump